VWISRLRSKLEADPSKPAIIKTLPGIGYLLDAESEMPAGEAGEVDEGDAPLEAEERNLAKA